MPSCLINISDLLQASDCYSQEVTVWVGLHRWRPFLVNIHIKISLGSFSFSLSFFSFFSSSLPLSLWGDSGGAFLFLLVGRQHLYLFAGSFASSPTSHFTTFCNFTQTRVSSGQTALMHLLRLLSARERVSLSSVSCLRLWWRGKTRFQLWLLAVIGLLVYVMSALCVAPGALQDEFPHHYSVLCQSPTGSLAPLPVYGLHIKKIFTPFFNVSQMPAALPATAGTECCRSDGVHR